MVFPICCADFVHPSPFCDFHRNIWNAEMPHKEILCLFKMIIGNSGCEHCIGAP